MSQPPPLRIAVIGVGYLGSRHAERIAQNPVFRLEAVYDRRPDQAREVAERLGCRAAVSLDDAIESAEAAVVATSTDSHREVTETLLHAGRPVLVEKPLTGRVADAEALVELAETRGLVLQVGHVERFNPAVRNLFGRIPPPLFVESHRLAPPVGRSLDIDVVQDLMIHDIDLTLAFMGREPVSVHASGVAVLTDQIDIANARLVFENGVSANLTASRVSIDRTRKFRMFLHGAYISADCGARKTQIYRLKPDRGDLVAALRKSEAPMEMLRFLDLERVGEDGVDALQAEHEAFAAAARGEASGGVSGREALAALRVMVRVEAAIRETVRSA